MGEQGGICILAFVVDFFDIESNDVLMFVEEGFWKQQKMLV
jgi:hypothetical protein